MWGFFGPGEGVALYRKVLIYHTCDYHLRKFMHAVYCGFSMIVILSSSPVPAAWRTRCVCTSAQGVEQLNIATLLFCIPVQIMLLIKPQHCVTLVEEWSSKEIINS